MDVEMIRRARQARAGIPVRDDLWLDEVLDKVGPCGSFLGERSTRLGARNGEWRLSDFGVQGSWDGWRAAGSPSTVAAARERVEQSSPSRSRCRTATTRRRPSRRCSAAPTPPPERAVMLGRRRAGAPPSHHLAFPES